MIAGLEMSPLKFTGFGVLPLSIGQESLLLLSLSPSLFLSTLQVVETEEEYVGHGPSTFSVKKTGLTPYGKPN